MADADPASPAALLTLDGVSKAFAGVHALSGVTMTARAGEVLALLGENGAGKSTLLRILGGIHAPDSGGVVLDGRPARFASPAAARAAGVRVVAQEPEIIPHVSVAENIFAGALPRRGRLLDRRRLREQVADLIARSGFADVIAPDMLGSRLSPAQRQVVEILRALIGEPRVIAFDEPTSSLSDHEVDALFALIGRLTASGVAVIYVSHRMAEIFRVAQRVLVLRDGRAVGERVLAGMTDAELVRMMVGRDLSAMFARSPRQPGRAVLSLSRLRNAALRDVSFDVCAGEVVVLAGLIGAGRTELARAIMGDAKLASGEIRMDGQVVHLASPRDAVRLGLCLAPEERKAEALLMKRSVRENISLGVLRRLSRHHVIGRGEERALARRYVADLRIRTPSIEQDVAKLSGGNQQKTVLARLLAQDSKVLILDEPTRGVDVGAKAEIYAIIDRLAASGAAVLVISSELPEVLGLADRIVVMQRGAVTGILSRDEASEERILGLAILDHEDQAA